MAAGYSAGSPAPDWVLRSVAEFQRQGDEAFERGEYFRALDSFDQATRRLEVLGEKQAKLHTDLVVAICYKKARVYGKIEDFSRCADNLGQCLHLDPAHTEAQELLKELAPRAARAKRKPSAKRKPKQAARGGAHPAPRAHGEVVVDRETDPAPVDPTVVVPSPPQSAPPQPLMSKVIPALHQQKEDGNKAIEQGDNAEAIRIYTSALHHLEELGRAQGSGMRELKATLLANRSLAHINLEEWEDAYRDAEGCLSLQPDHQKALFRKTMAEEKLVVQRAQQQRAEVLKRALLFKNSGNQALAEGRHAAAAEEYTGGLEWLEELPHGDSAAREVKLALLSNRAQARIRQGAYRQAIDDADIVLAYESA